MSQPGLPWLKKSEAGSVAPVPAWKHLKSASRTTKDEPIASSSRLQQEVELPPQFKTSTTFKKSEPRRAQFDLPRQFLKLPPQFDHLTESKRPKFQLPPQFQRFREKPEFQLPPQFDVPTSLEVQHVELDNGQGATVKRKMKSPEPSEVAEDVDGMSMASLTLHEDPGTEVIDLTSAARDDDYQAVRSPSSAWNIITY